MEVVVPVGVSAPPPVVDFNFDSNCSSPYITAPSSPQRFGNSLFFSAPTSPTRVSPLFNPFPPSVSSVPFHWEQKPGIPKPNHDHDNNNNNNVDDDFEFNFSGNLERASLSAADELFDGGKIRPLKLPPRLQSGDGPISPTTTRSPSPRRRIAQGKKKVSSDPFEAAIEETRGRTERVSSSSSSTSGRRGSRSLSPLRVSDIVCESEVDVSSSASNGKSFLSFTKGYRKWRFRDFLLFRSASEGRATDKKDPLRKYTVLSKKPSAPEEQDVRNSSFRSTESSGSVSRRRGPVSAHELHYTLNRAATEEMKKKTPLPYKQGLLGCLGFNNHGMHQISRGIGSFSSRS